MDISHTLAPKSDQINADDLIAGSRTVTITEVRVPDGDQPVHIITAEFGPKRPYKPSKGMRRLLSMVYGSESDNWVGHRLTLFRDPEVEWAGEPVGGIRVSHMSGIDKPISVAMTVKRGRRQSVIIEPLPAERPAPEPLGDRIAKAVDWFAGQGVDVAALEAHVALPRAEWTEATLRTLQDDREQIVGGGQ